MSIATEIARIQSDRNTIRTKLVDLGLVEITADLDDCATAVEGIENRGSVSATVQEGDTYTIPKGYHNGSGTVSGVAGGGNYSLQSKTITPTKAQQNVTPDSGYYGLSDVTVAAIPANFQDVTPVTAAAGDVLANKIIVDANGKTVAGTMVNNGAVSKTLDTSTTSYVVPSGYHDGKGTVKVVSEERSATPAKTEQVVIPSSGKVLSKVTIAAIPDTYQDVTGVTATPDKVLSDVEFVGPDGVLTNGSMTNNGAIEEVLTVSSPKIQIPAGYHNGNGTVEIYVLTQNVTPTKEEQIVTPKYDDSVLGEVIVDPIPEKYQDVSAVTTSAANVLEGGKFVDSYGNVVEGTMPNNGSISAVLDKATYEIKIPDGYTSGGTVKIVQASASAVPSKTEQRITPSSGTVFTSVYVAPIPDEYQDVTGVTATASTVLSGSSFIDSDGNKVEGSIQSYANNYTMDGLTQTSVNIPEGFHGGTTVSLTADIETQLAAI